MKFCVNCRHYKEGLCFSPQLSREANLVTGKPAYPYSSCPYERDHNWITTRLFNCCGAEARWFEPEFDDHG